MSYGRSPDVLEFIANLNRIPSESDILSSSTSTTDHFSLDKNLAMFSNTQFFDFDLSHDADLQATTYKAGTDPTVSLPDYSFGKFGNFPSVFDHQDAGHDSVAVQINTTAAPFNSSSPSPNCKDPLNNQFQNSNIKSPSSCADINEISRQAAEEDKRRRNTAASARFRIKKKQREQALEKSAKEMSDKVAQLENRIRMLETENKWLKDLITTKNEDRPRDNWFDSENFCKQQNEEKIPDGRSDGVGTEVTS